MLWPKGGQRGFLQSKSVSFDQRLARAVRRGSRISPGEGNLLMINLVCRLHESIGPHAWC